MTQPLQGKDWREEFDKKWKRMRENGMGKNSSIGGRMIWCVDPDDEDGWAYVDESIKSYISQLLTSFGEEVLGITDEELKKYEEGYSSHAAVSQTKEAISKVLKRYE